MYKHVVQKKEKSSFSKPNSIWSSFLSHMINWGSIEVMDKEKNLFTIKSNAYVCIQPDPRKLKVECMKARDAYAIKTTGGRRLIDWPHLIRIGPTSNSLNEHDCRQECIINSEIEAKLRIEKNIAKIFNDLDGNELSKKQMENLYLAQLNVIAFQQTDILNRISLSEQRYAIIKAEKDFKLNPFSEEGKNEFKQLIKKAASFAKVSEILFYLYRITTRLPFSSKRKYKYAKDKEIEIEELSPSIEIKKKLSFIVDSMKTPLDYIGMRETLSRFFKNTSGSSIPDRLEKGVQSSLKKNIPSTNPPPHSSTSPSPHSSTNPEEPINIPTNIPPSTTLSSSDITSEIQKMELKQGKQRPIFPTKSIPIRLQESITQNVSRSIYDNWRRKDVNKPEIESKGREQIESEEREQIEPEKREGVEGVEGVESEEREGVEEVESEEEEESRKTKKKRKKKSNLKHTQSKPSSHFPVQRERPATTTSTEIPIEFIESSVQSIESTQSTKSTQSTESTQSSSNTSYFIPPPPPAPPPPATINFAPYKNLLNTENIIRNKLEDFIIALETKTKMQTGIIIQILQDFLPVFSKTTKTKEKDVSKEIKIDKTDDKSARIIEIFLSTFNKFHEQNSISARMNENTIRDLFFNHFLIDDCQLTKQTKNDFNLMKEVIELYKGKEDDQLRKNVKDFFAYISYLTKIDLDILISLIEGCNKICVITEEIEDFQKSIYYSYLKQENDNINSEKFSGYYFDLFTKQLITYFQKNYLLETKKLPDQSYYSYFTSLFSNVLLMNTFFRKAYNAWGEKPNEFDNLKTLFQMVSSKNGKKAMNMIELDNFFNNEISDLKDETTYSSDIRKFLFAIDDSKRFFEKFIEQHNIISANMKEVIFQKLESLKKKVEEIKENKIYNVYRKWVEMLGYGIEISMTKKKNVTFTKTALNDVDIVQKYPANKIIEDIKQIELIFPKLIKNVPQ